LKKNFGIFLTGGSAFEIKLVKKLKILDEEYNIFRNACNVRPKIFEGKYGNYYCSREIPKKIKNSFSIQNSWLFVRPTFGWGITYGCGVHADFTDLKRCSKNIKKYIPFLRNFHYITILREPLARYVSEWFSKN
jgi:hypothetical protein